MNPEVMSAEIQLIKARLDALEKGRAPTTQAVAVADDEDLDSEWGDPIVKKDPPRWKGEPCAGRRMSECPADYLRQLAGLYDWQATKDEEQSKTYVNKKGETVPTAPFKRKDARRARGWAARNAGKPAPQPAAAAVDDPYASRGDAFEEEIPF